VSILIKVGGGRAREDGDDNHEDDEDGVNIDNIDEE
jgi:hypothetical protein